jgi:phospholipase/lecithinase/hemolysin
MNVTQAGFHSTIMDTYFAQLQLLYTAGARSFLLLSVPPIDRAPLFYAQGPTVTSAVFASVEDYNEQLSQRAKKFQAMNSEANVMVYDTSKVFNKVLNNAEALGFVNVTGYADPYANGTPSPTTQVAGYPPVSSYFWLNTLHPLYTVH